MSNKLDLRKTVGELSRVYPELPDILRELGLPEAGEAVTIPRRAALGERSTRQWTLKNTSPFLRASTA